MFRGFTTKEYDAIIHAMRISAAHILPWIAKACMILIFLFMCLVLIGVIPFGK